MDFGLIFGIAAVALGIFVGFVAIRLVQANNDDDLDPNNRL